MVSVNEDIRRWKIRSRLLFVIQAALLCVFGGLSVIHFLSCSKNVYCFRAINTGTLMLIYGALQLLLTVGCSCVTVDRRKLKYMFVTYVLWSVWVMFSSAFHWQNIYESTQTWTDFVTLSTVLMALYVILMIVQCVLFGVIIHQLPQRETYDGTTTDNKAD